MDITQAKELIANHGQRLPEELITAGFDEAGIFDTLIFKFAAALEINNDFVDHATSIENAKEIVASHSQHLPEALITAINSGYFSESFIISLGHVLEHAIERDNASADPENSESYADARARRLAEGHGPTELTPEEQERVAKRVAEADISVAHAVRDLAALSTSTTEDTNA